ncbi:hypothetical protein AMTRI_Chr05g60840 [Amborella trichopoda]
MIELANNWLSELLEALKNWFSLITLDLSYNELAGNIPSWIGESLSRLKYVNLRTNKFIGRLPQALTQLSFFQVLDLSGNRLSGPIPKSFGIFTAMRIAIEVNGSMIYYEIMTLSLVKSIDLSSNHLKGEIPEELTCLLGMVFLNLSRNHLSGVNPERIAKLERLQSLDLLNNQLSGIIPPLISSMISLSVLNLSNNNLFGQIPTGNQMKTFNTSIYSENPYLSLPPPIQGSKGKPEPPPSIDRIERSRKIFEFSWLDMSNRLGFGVGFRGTTLLLFIRKSWTDACFRCMDKIVVMLLRFCK